MCRFKSGIILKDKVVIAPEDNDSHSDLLESLGIEDSYIGASKTFVRAELVPKNDSEWWIDPAENPEKWMFVVDQDITPDWFDKETHEKEFRESICEWWRTHVLVDKKLEDLRTGFYRLKRCDLKKLLNDVHVMLDSSQVGEMRGSSQVGEMWGSSQVGVMLDSSQVGKMRGSSQVGVMLDSSQVGEMWGSSQVGKMWDSSQVGKMWGSSTARDFKNYPFIKIMIPDNGKFEMVVHKNKDEE